MANLDTSNNNAVRVITAAVAATADPTTATVGDRNGNAKRIRLYVTYGGTVTAAELRVWVKNPVDGNYFRGYSTASNVLVPAAVREMREYDIGAENTFFVQVVTLTGTTPTITVDVQSVRT